MNTILLCATDGWVTAISTTALAILTTFLAFYAKGAYEEGKKSYRTSMLQITKDRVITIIYNQLDRIEKAIESFEITDLENGKHTGHEALLFLSSKISQFTPVFHKGKTEEQIFQARKEVNEDNLKLLVPNADQIYVLSNRLYNAIGIVKETLLQRELGIEEINRLKKLLFSNIGFMYMNLIKSIVQNNDDYFELYKTDKSYKVDIGRLFEATIFLCSIINFEVAKFTEDNFEATRVELLK